MNRKERRNLIKKQVPNSERDRAMKAVKIALEKQKEMYYKQVKEEKMQAIDVILTMTAYTLNYKLGLGRKRLPDIMANILDNIDAFNTGHLTKEDFDEIHKQMEELGVRSKNK